MWVSETKKEGKVEFQGAVIKEQGQTFGIVIVKPTVLNSPSSREEMTAFGIRAFGPMPIVLMAQDSKGVPTYSGRTDIVRFLANIFVDQIPWTKYTIS
jgi:hypothetical protein